MYVLSVRDIKGGFVYILPFDSPKILTQKGRCIVTGGSELSCLPKPAQLIMTPPWEVHIVDMILFNLPPKPGRKVLWSSPLQRQMKL